MAPVKFDDIAKTSKEVLSDDYQISGYQFKAKQKTSLQGMVLTSTVDLFPAKDSCMTPAKLAWKLPTPFGCPYFAVDKLELDKAGGIKIEASSDKALADKSLKMEAKSDLLDPSKLLATCTYTGIKDAQVKFETKAANPQDCVFECTYASMVSGAAVTLGLKGTGSTLTAPDLGARMLYGSFFGSLYAKQKLSAFSLSCHYKASDVLRCAATYEHGGKMNGQFCLGVSYDVKPGTKVKAKIAQDQSISCSVKHDVNKGFTVVAGAKVDMNKMDIASCGLQLSIE
uniref:Uncharacterized protein n=1 Tax=Strombidinopsis acuminata TaxID=141414 RepID=A0A7S3VVQ3_9SPIT